MQRVRKEYLTRTYGIAEWESPIDFLEQYARKIGKLLKGSEPDTNAAAKLVLHDFQRGRLPYFTLPPGHLPQPEPRNAAERAAEAGVRAKRQSMKELVPSHEFVPSDLRVRGAGVEEGEEEEGEEDGEEEEGEEEEGEEEEGDDDEEEGEDGESVSEDEEGDEEDDDEEGEEEEEEEEEEPEPEPASKPTGGKAKGKAAVALSKVVAVAKSALKAVVPKAAAPKAAAPKAAAPKAAVSWEDVFDAV
jgi:nuclear GTP-binding protein